MEKEEAIYYLRKKMVKSNEVIKYLSIEAIDLIEDSEYDTQRVLDWFHKVEKAFYEEI